MSQSETDRFFDYFEQVRHLQADASKTREAASRTADRVGYWAAGTPPEEILEAYPRPDLREYLHPEVKGLLEAEEGLHDRIATLGDQATREFVGRPIRIASLTLSHSPIERFRPSNDYQNRSTEARRAQGTLAGMRLSIIPASGRSSRQIMVVQGRRLLPDLYYRADVVGPAINSWHGAPPALKRLVHLEFLD